jgi:3-hydroxy-9,10-secoandrosta-1,3,5(10)-triene-9,17-dione monooxygenase reductase component
MPVDAMPLSTTDLTIVPPPDPAADVRALRVALGRFATGVTVVTCLSPGGERVGLTANSFNSLSLDPPLVLWSLRRVSPSLAAFVAASHFAINVLTDDQVEVSRHFAMPGGDRFAQGSWAVGIGGVPLLAGCAATFQCETCSHQTAGDHELFIGRVVAIAEAPLAPLVFQSGHYHLLGEIL